MHTENLILSSIRLENTPCLWEKNDILIFFIDLDNYDTLSTEFLNNSEKENLEKLQTSYFKERFIVSRIVLKHILCALLKTESIQNISTYKDRYGEVHIPGHEDLHVCISYSKNIIALAISKFKIGIDIETKRSLELKSTLKYLQNSSLYSGNSTAHSSLLNAWTLKEAYCKYSNINMLSFLNKEPDLNNISYSSFLLDDKYIFSVVTESGRHKININHLRKFI